MAKFSKDTTGNVDDRVRLVLGQDDVHVSETYDVRIGVFNQPSSFSLKLGSADTASTLLKKYPNRTPFRLYIGDVKQQTGRTDARASRGTGGTSITFKGRDNLAPLHDDHIDAERTFNDKTYVELARAQLKAVGLGGVPIHASNLANRRIRSGVALAELAPGRTVDQILTGAAAPASSGVSLVHQQIQARLNERRYEFLLRYLQLAGLFFWAAADGTFVMAEPNANQKAMATIFRRVGQTRLETNVVDHDLNDDTTHRFKEYSVYGLGAGKKNVHAKALGVFVDDEMFNLGFEKHKVWRAQNARTRQQAEFLARRMAAEDRRNGYQLKYTLAGHTTPFTRGGERAVWTPDTIVHVDDEILGIQKDFYVAEVSYRCPPTTTDIVLMRPEDLVFGPSEFPESSTAGIKPTLAPGRTVSQILKGTK